MRKSEEMPFALLRASLHEKETETLFFVGATETDWDKCFLLAKKQGVMALAWDGVLKLPNSLHPDMEFKLQWGIKVEHLERKYQRYCKVAHEITKLYKQPFPKSKLGIVVYKVRRFIYTQKLKREIFNNSFWKFLSCSICDIRKKFSIKP